MKILNYESNKHPEMLASQALVESILSLQPMQPYLLLKIRRNRLVHDSLFQVDIEFIFAVYFTMFLQLSSQKQNLRKKLMVEFEGESGLDAGGLTKEWLLLLVRELFGDTYDIFYTEEESKLLWFNVNKKSIVQLEIYRLCGIIVGLGMNNNVILDLNFPLICYKKLLGKRGTLEDLKWFMPSLYKNLKYLLTYAKDDVEDVFCLNFSYYDKDLEMSFDLMTNKPTEDATLTSEVIVTQQNKSVYVQKFIDYMLNTRVDSILNAFTAGFMSVCSGHALGLMRPCEIEVLVSGSKETQLNIHLIRENSTYTDGFAPNDPFIE